MAHNFFQTEILIGAAPTECSDDQNPTKCSKCQHGVEALFVVNSTEKEAENPFLIAF